LPDREPASRTDGVVLGTAGHIDHGKTALIGALTGTDTDRLEEERRRGISIELGFTELPLPDGRSIGVVDVPGHERLIRTMVAGATGIDLFLLVIAADDGVMPQTREHLIVLRSLGVERGVVALTKHDAAPPESLELARAEAAELLPGAPVVAVSARTGHGVEELRRAIAGQVELAAAARSRGPDWAPLPALLPLDRVFTLKGIGTVATGTLRGGGVAPGDPLLAHPAGAECRVRIVQVHGVPVERAVAGQRVAVSVTGPGRRGLERGDVLAAPIDDLAPSYRLDAELDFDHESEPAAARVQVHHGTRQSAARIVALGGRLVQLRLEAPLIALPGDRFVVRRIAPPATLGGGRVIDQDPRRHGESAATELRRALGADPEQILLAALARAGGSLPADPATWRTRPLIGHALERHPPERWRQAVDALVDAGEAGHEAGTLRLAVGSEPARPPTAAPVQLDRTALVVLALLDSQGLQPAAPAAVAAELGLPRARVDDAVDALLEAGRLVRLRGEVLYPASRLEAIVGQVRDLLDDRGEITLAGLRDELAITRKYSQAILEHIDQLRVTVRIGDRHVLRRPSRAGTGSSAEID
jgi:selenocysteine-specific elongation factor